MSMLFRQSVGALVSSTPNLHVGGQAELLMLPYSGKTLQRSRSAPASLFAAQSSARYMPQLGLTAARCLSTETRAKIDAAVKSTPIVVFMKGTPQQPMCGFSRAVAIIMEVNNIKKDKFKSFNILEDQELRAAIKEYSEWPTIPQVYIDGEFVGGCDLMTQSTFFALPPPLR